MLQKLFSQTWCSSHFFDVLNIGRWHLLWHTTLLHISDHTGKFSALSILIIKITWPSSIFHCNSLNHYCRSIWPISKLWASILEESVDTRSVKIISVISSVIFAMKLLPEFPPSSFLLIHLRIAFSVLHR